MTAGSVAAGCGNRFNYLQLFGFLTLVDVPYSAENHSLLVVYCSKYSSSLMDNVG